MIVNITNKHIPNAYSKSILIKKDREPSMPVTPVIRPGACWFMDPEGRLQTTKHGHINML